MEEKIENQVLFRFTPSYIAEVDFKFDSLEFDRRAIENVFPRPGLRLEPNSLVNLLENNPSQLRRIKRLRFLFGKLICLSLFFIGVSAVALYILENHLDKTAEYISVVLVVFLASALGILVAIMMKCYFEPKAVLSYVQEISSLVDIHNEDNPDMKALVKYSTELDTLSIEISLRDQESGDIDDDDDLVKTKEIDQENDDEYAYKVQNEQQNYNEEAQSHQKGNSESSIDYNALEI